MIKAKARIIYDPHRPGMKRRTKWWCVANVINGDEICRYFRWWVEKEILNPLGIRDTGSLKKYPHNVLHQPSWGSHVSVIRGEKPHSGFTHLWGKYHNEVVDIEISHYVKQAKNSINEEDIGKLWFVEVNSDDLIKIRKELEFPTNWPLHMTIGRLS